METGTDENALSKSVPIVKIKPIEPKALVEASMPGMELLEQSLGLLGSSPKADNVLMSPKKGPEGFAKPSGKVSLFILSALHTTYALSGRKRNSSICNDNSYGLLLELPCAPESLS